MTFCWLILSWITVDCSTSITKNSCRNIHK